MTKKHALMERRPYVVTCASWPVYPLPEVIVLPSQWILFLSNIPPEVNTLMHPLLSLCGRFVRQTSGIAPSGMRFVALAYNDLESLRKAEHYLNRIPFGNHQIAVNYPPVGNVSAHSCSLFVTNLSEWVNEEVVYALFRPYGLLALVKMERHSADGIKCAVVTFFAPFSREVARVLLHGHNLGDGFRISVQPIPPPGMPEPYVAYRPQPRAAVGFCVRISIIDPKLTEDRLYELFAQYGEVLQLCLFRSYDGRPFGFVVVRYALEESVHKAMHGLHGAVLEKHLLIVKRVSASLLP